MASKCLQNKKYQTNKPTAPELVRFTDQHTPRPPLCIVHAAPEPVPASPPPLDTHTSGRFLIPKLWKNFFFFLAGVGLRKGLSASGRVRLGFLSI